MSDRNDQIFILEEGELKSLPIRQMRTGLFGKSLEDALQTIFEKYPAILPGVQIDPAGEDPPRFVLLRREMPVGGWSLDHLFVDQFGVLTLVETKLFQNPESRREVIGQIIEYASNAKAEWSHGLARQYASEYWIKQDRDLDDVLHDAFPHTDLSILWQQVDANLEQGRIRLIIASDSIRPEVRRMIEYLNSEMNNVEVLGLELPIYGEEEGQLILAPRIIGQTQALADQRAPTGAGVVWNVSMLREGFKQVAGDEADRLLSLLDWAIENDCFMSSRAQSPNFGLASRTGDRVVGAYHTGVLYLFFEEQKYPDGRRDRDQMVDDLKAMYLLASDIEPNEVKSGRSFSRPLSELNQNEFENLLQILSHICVNDDGSA